mgnify:CR=1 FL=1
MQNIVNNKLFRNIALMSSATVAAQLINVVIQPILTRIVPAETLGIFTFLVSMANIAIPVASLKLDLLITSDADDERAQYITDACIVITTLISLLFLCVIGGGYILNAHVFCQYGPIIFTVPIMVLTNGIRFLFISYNNRYRQYKIIGVVGILRELTRGIIQIVSGLFALGALGQVAGYALAPMSGLKKQTAGYAAKFIKRKRLDFAIFKDIILKGKKQILYLVPAQFLNSFSSSLIILFISILYSTEQLGYYSAGVRLLEIPMIFITANVSKVFYKQISEDVNQKARVSSKFIKISVSLFIVSVLAFGILYFIAPQFSRFVFGADYEVAGEYIKCLCLMYTVRMVATSFTGLFTIFGRQQMELCLIIFLIVAVSVVYMVSRKMSLPIITFMWLISISYTIMYLILWMGYFCLCKSHDINLRKK